MRLVRNDGTSFERRMSSIRFSVNRNLSLRVNRQFFDTSESNYSEIIRYFSLFRLLFCLYQLNQCVVCCRY